MRLKFKLTIIAILLFMPLLYTLGQTVNFQPGVSIRDNQQSHYYKMVGWEDSAYQEFAYWKESSGSVTEFMNWRAIFPPGYDPNDGVEYPMIVMLHGAGESGRKWTDNFNYTPSDPQYDNNGRNLYWGGKPHRDAVNDGTFPGIVMFPQCSYNGAWDADDRRMLAKVIEYMISDQKVNPFRIYLHGLSNGGKASWEFSEYRSDLIAAFLPMSGVGTDMEPTTDQLLTTPVWLFQGGQDSNPSPGAAEMWINKLEEKGGKPRYTLYDTVSHISWTHAYAEPDFFSWMIDKDKRNIYVFGDTSNLSIAEGGTIDLGFSAGYSDYQWKLDGQPISGADTRYYTADEAGTYTVEFLQPINGQWGESFPLEIGGYTGATVVHIPDVNFKSKLLSDTTINTNGDGHIQVAEATAFSGQLDVGSNNISDLTGIAAFTGVTDLRVHSNNLASLDLSSNTELVELHCQGNQLENLDVSANENLEKLKCFDNHLVSLNVQNGNNQNFSLFQANNNYLTCILVDDVTHAEANWSEHVDEDVEFSTDCGGVVIFIADPNFKDALVANTAINTSGDGNIQAAEAEAYTGPINVAGLQIETLHGVGAFPGITMLDFSNNNVSSLDLSGNTELSEVYGDQNQLTSIKFGDNSNLTVLHLGDNSLKRIDIDGVVNLVELQVPLNRLINLDLRDHTHLETIVCNDNNLEVLNLKNNHNDIISSFVASNNRLSCIEVSDEEYADVNWANDVDAGVRFSVDCSAAPLGQDELSENDLLIYPNPFTDIVKIRISEHAEINLSTFRILDLQTGARLSPVEISYVQNEVELDLSNLASGNYLIQIGGSTYRVVKAQ